MVVVDNLPCPPAGKRGLRWRQRPREQAREGRQQSPTTGDSAGDELLATVMNQARSLSRNASKVEISVARSLILELSHFREASDVISSPVPNMLGKPPNLALTWALKRKPQEQVTISTFIDTICQELVISFTAVVGYFRAPCP